MDYKLHPQRSFLLFFLIFSFLYFVFLAEAIIAKHCLLKVFPDLPLLFALVVILHLSFISIISLQFGGFSIFLTNSEFFKIRAMFGHLYTCTEYIAGA